MLSPRGRKPKYGQDYKSIPFSKMKVNDTHLLFKVLDSKAVTAMSKRIKDLSESMYKHKTFDVVVTRKNVLVRRVK